MAGAAPFYRDVADGRGDTGEAGELAAERRARVAELAAEAARALAGGDRSRARELYRVVLSLAPGHLAAAAALDELNAARPEVGLRP